MIEGVKVEMVINYSRCYDYQKRITEVIDFSKRGDKAAAPIANEKVTESMNLSRP